MTSINGLTQDYDVFISHASEDKLSVALPLADELRARGFRVWLDALELTVGDSLRAAIDKGLSRSRFGVVVLSPHFFAKKWPQQELDGLFFKETPSSKVILPVWHNITGEVLSGISPLISARLAVSTGKGIPHVASELVKAMNRETGLFQAQPEQDDPFDSEIKSLRSKVFLASSLRELKRSKYEAEELLSRYPLHPEALELKADVARAIEREEGPWFQQQRQPPLDPEYSSYSSFSWFSVIAATIVMGGAGYLIYRLISWIVKMKF